MNNADKLKRTADSAELDESFFLALTARVHQVAQSQGLEEAAELLRKELGM